MTDQIREILRQYVVEIAPLVGCPHDDEKLIDEIGVGRYVQYEPRDDRSIESYLDPAPSLFADHARATHVAALYNARNQHPTLCRAVVSRW